MPVYEKKQDSSGSFYYIIKGDTIPREFIDLEMVVLLNDLSFDSLEERKRYYILSRKTRKVYPYAKMAAERLQTMNKRLAELKGKKQRRKYTKRIQKYIEGEFSDRLKKLTRTEGQILIKLIHRQTGITAYKLVKDLRTGVKAFMYNTTASFFDISLKKEYNPYKIEEDYLIEDILERSFQSSILERQKPAFPIDYFDLVAIWNKKKK